jgi:cell division protease FtsH
MDGFGSHEGIIVIAATNRPDILDPALLRPGRFDRRVTVNYPDIKGREEILRVHARKKPIEADVDFRKVAQTTVGFTGADLANLLNEAALLAAKRDKTLIGMDEINDSFMKLILGPQKKAHVRNEHDNKLTAYHEAGHAVSSYYCEHTDPVKVITIIPAGNAGGVTVSVPTEDSMCHSKNEMFESIVWALGGRVAEELVMEDISTGASSDIQHATATARKMITRYGMSEKLGTVLYGSEHSSDEVFLGRDFSSGKNYSEKTAAEIDDEIRALIDKAYKKCREILMAHMDKLEFVAQYLLLRETMDGEQFKAAMEGDVTFGELDTMVEEKRRKSEEENRKRAEKLKEEEMLRRIDEENKAKEAKNNDDDEPPFNRYAK